MGFWYCVIYIAALGVAMFLLGRALPKQWFRWDAFPYRDFPFERKGKLYDKLGIRFWQKKVPDMSRLFRRLMPPKKLSGALDAPTLTLMLRETCAAELTHWVLSLLGLGCIWLWKKLGWLFYLVYFLLGNLPFILIQRYNRPRLAALLRRVERRSGAGQEGLSCGS